MARDQLEKQFRDISGQGPMAKAGTPQKIMAFAAFLTTDHTQPDRVCGLYIQS
jgi:hypothetical protein